MEHSTLRLRKLGEVFQSKIRKQRGQEGKIYISLQDTDKNKDTACM